MGSDKYRTEDQLHKIPLRVTDTTLRDAHQSLWATRMRTDDILGIIDVIDNVGYYSLECWGGATFDVCLRFLRENPWERLRQIKSRAKNTPLQMLLRGQNLVGYRNYADDVVDRFVGLACENGIDIFRVFDALNDTRNLEAAVRAIKKHDAHAQGTLCYTISPVHTVDKFVLYAKEQVEIGVDSLCIKDMAGILSPIAAERLVRALVREVHVPIQLHCHSSSGMAVATYVEGVRAGLTAPCRPWQGFPPSRRWRRLPLSSRRPTIRRTSTWKLSSVSPNISPRLLPNEGRRAVCCRISTPISLPIRSREA
jgi:oxaloacetate decarboxylase alpha subunit